MLGGITSSVNPEEVELAGGAGRTGAGDLQPSTEGA